MVNIFPCVGSTGDAGPAEEAPLCGDDLDDDDDDDPDNFFAGASGVYFFCVALISAGLFFIFFNVAHRLARMMIWL